MGEPLPIHRNLPATPSAFRSWHLSRWLPWTTRANGRAFDFRMPSRVHGPLSERLAGLVRDGAATAAEAIAAHRLAIALVLHHGGNMRAFCLCRRGLATIGNLDLSEWLCRRGRELLERVGFVERDPSFARWQPYNPDEEPFDRSRARRQPTVFRFGKDFVTALYFAFRKVRLRPASRIQVKDFAPTEVEGASSSLGRGDHSGERIVLHLMPRWRSTPGHQPPLPFRGNPDG